MRTITHGDVIAAARAVRGLSSETQRRMVLNFLNRAHAANRFRKRLGRAHPLWGNGTLIAVALGDAPRRPEPFLSDTTYLEALALVIETVLDWRRRAR